MLSAAVDGNIDAIEKETIISRLSATNRILVVTEELIFHIQQQLREKIASGETPRYIVNCASRVLSEEYKIFCYAIVVDVVLSNLVLEESETEFLKLLRTQFDLDANKVSCIHMSAEIRYGLPIT